MQLFLWCTYASLVWPNQNYLQSVSTSTCKNIRSGAQLEMLNSYVIYMHCRRLTKHFNTSGQLRGIKNNLAIQMAPDPIFYMGAYIESNNPCEKHSSLATEDYTCPTKAPG